MTTTLNRKNSSSSPASSRSAQKARPLPKTAEDTVVGSHEWRAVKLLRDSPIHLMRRVTQAYYRRWQEQLPTLSAQQFGVLAVIRRFGSISQAEISRLTAIDVSTLAEMLARLERRGIVSRKMDPRNNRKYLVSLEADAERELEAAMKTENRITKEMWSPLTPEENQVLLSLLHKLIT